MLARVCKRYSSSATRTREAGASLDMSRQIRETKTVFPRPRFITFDLFGTIYTPKKAVYQQYAEVASKEFGIRVNSAQIKERFPILHSEMMAQYPNYGRGSREIVDADHWWSELIVRLFEVPHFSRDEGSQQLCKRLLAFFTGPEAYHVYDDVLPVLRDLQSKGIRMGFLSNSDPRVFQIVQNLGLLEFVNDNNIYISYTHGYSKPDKRIFDKVVSEHFRPSSAIDAPTKSDFLERCWHVGDSYEKDFLGAVKAGWNGVLLDRSETSKFFKSIHEAAAQSHYAGCGLSEYAEKPKEHSAIHLANNRVVLNDLSLLVDLFP